MHINKLLNKSFLIVELLPGQVTCTIACCKDGQLKTLVSETTKSVGALDAVTEAIDRLARYVKKLPKYAVMLSSEVSCGWINLQIPDSLNDNEVRELLRWELESQLDGFGSAPKIENLLFYSSYLDAAQKDKIFTKAKEAGISPLAAARSLNFLTPDEISQLEIFVGEYPDCSSEYLTAWVPSHKLYPNDQSLVAAMPMDYADEWINFFDKRGISLQATYGINGLTLAAIDAKVVSGKSTVILDCNMLHLQATYIKGSRIVDTGIYQLKPKEIPKELIHDIIFHRTEHIHLGNSQINFDEIDSLVNKAEPELYLRAIEIAQESSLAQIALGRIICESNIYPVPQLKTAAPPVPFYKNPSLYWSLSIVTAACFVFGFFWNNHQQFIKISNEIEIINAKKASFKRVEVHPDDPLEIESLLTEQLKIEELLARKEARVDPRFLASYYVSTLQATSQSMSDAIDIVYLNIDSVGKVSFSGYSVAEADVYSFSARFKESMLQWKLIPQETVLFADSKAGIHGFTIKPKEFKHGSQ